MSLFNGKMPPMAKENSEIKELSDAIDKYEAAAFEGRRTLIDVADEREQLLNDEAATVEMFGALNARRDAATISIEKAARIVPRLKEKLAVLHERRRADRAGEHRRIAILFTKKFKGKLQEAFAVKGEAAEHRREYLRELGPSADAKYGLCDIDFHNPLTAEGVADWDRYVAQQLMHEGQAYVEPPRVVSKPIEIPPPDETGKLRILYLAREGKFQPGDCVSVPYRDAEKLIRHGRAEPAQKAIEPGELKSVGSAA
jgi:hypothetical protein